MTTDENIIKCYNDLKECVDIGYPTLTEYERKIVKLHKNHMLKKFEIWMAEDLQRLGLINNTK